jgi:hypothetical protein
LTAADDPEQELANALRTLLGGRDAALAATSPGKSKEES